MTGDAIGAAGQAPRSGERPATGILDFEGYTVMSVTHWIEQAPESVRERFEYVRGRWREREIPTWGHQRCTRHLVNELERRGLQANGGVRVYLPVPGADEPDWVVPDALVVARANPVQPGPVQPGPGFYSGVPDLVAEVLADDNDDGEDLVKKAQYAAAGVRHYWLVRLKWGTLEASELGPDGRYHQTGAGDWPPRPLERLPVPEDLR
jgi:Uma2 family endonuclease